jgi:hypothetical protein
VRGFWKRDDELHRLEAELRANRPEPPRGFIRTLVESQRGEDRWLRPKVRVGVAVVLVGLALAAMASAGGFGVIAHTTKAAVKVMQRTTHPSSRLTVFDSPGNKQYQKHCGGIDPPGGKCHITIFDSSVREGNSGITIMTFQLSLDAINDAPVTVNWATSDNGSAVGGSSCAGANSGSPDYISTGGTVTFPTGTPTQTITVQVCGDTKVEPNETFKVNLTAPSPNADIFRTPATGTIVNDDR